MPLNGFPTLLNTGLLSRIIKMADLTGRMER